MRLIGQPFTILETVDSTNNYAMRAVHAGLARHGYVYLALHQTSGKGQRGKTWSTNPGENIAMSIVLEPGKLLLSDQFLLSIFIALSCCDLFNEYAAGEFRIKWPNDIYWRDRKAGGILIENVLQGTQWQFAIVGIGLNVNQTLFAADLPNPVSLKQVTGKQFDIHALARQLCTFVAKRLENTGAVRSNALLQEYNCLLYKCNEIVKLKRENIVFETRVTGVSRQGRLITKAAIEQEFDWGEVEWVL